MNKHTPMTFEFHKAFLEVSADLENEGSIYEIHSKKDALFSMSRTDEPDDLSGEEPEFVADVLRWKAETKVRLQAMLDLLVNGKNYLLCKVYDNVDYDGWDKDIVIEVFEYKVDAEAKMAYLNYLEIIRRADELLAKQPQ